jgi:hypothetical protein
MSIGKRAAHEVVAGLLDVLAREQRQLAPVLPERLAVCIGQLAEAPPIERHVPRGVT